MISARLLETSLPLEVMVAVDLRIADIRLAGMLVVLLMTDLPMAGLPSALVILLLLDLLSAAILPGHPFQTFLRVAPRVDSINATILVV